MTSLRRNLHQLNWGRAIAATTLLLAGLTIQALFAPESPFSWLYAMTGLVFAAILGYALIDHWLGERGLSVGLQVAGDILLVGGFVLASGGAGSPVSFLFALPVMVAAGLAGKRGGLLAAGGAWCTYGAILIRELYFLGPADITPARAFYSAVSHLLGFFLLGLLGGMLADRLRTTSRELAEHKGNLAALRALQTIIVESINTGLVAVNEDGRISFINRAGLEILRSPAEMLLARPLESLFGFPSGLLLEASALADSGRRSRFERKWRRPSDGEELFLGFAVAPLRQQQETGPRGWLVVFQDLTEIASLEAQVRTRERMAALGEMAAGMAHELRNPLAAISGCVQMLASAGGGPGNLGSLAGVALSETHRLNRIIKDFLDFARPGPLRPRSVDLLPLMEEMARFLRKSPDFKPNHQVSVISGPGSHTALVDPDRLRQVFWNLAGNALKAMPEGGLLTVEVAGYGGDQVQLSFRDQGEGMDEDVQARLFQPFQGHFREGTGLGGAIVYRIAEEHGGRVQVLSRPGRGAEIRIILPAARPESEAGGFLGAVTAGPAAAVPAEEPAPAGASGS